MRVLVLGGTKFFGVHMVREFLRQGDEVTIATRGLKKDEFADSVNRITIERTSAESLAKAFAGMTYDVICDNISYCSEDVRVLLDNVKCKRYIMTSTSSVYNFVPNLKEEDFSPFTNELIWCNRLEFPYGEIKRQAETAIFKHYTSQEACAVRFPYVIGNDDYTERLYFYVDHVVNSKPMNIDNFDEQIAFIRSDDAGKFLVHLAKSNFTGPINACADGTMSVREIINYVENKTNIKAIYAENADNGAYNGTPSFYLNTEKAEGIGYKFLPLKSWMYELLDEFIVCAQK
jgi:nucleoside-diphosphate-sugar epimerase